MDRFVSRALLLAALVASACSKSGKTELPSGTVLGKAFTPVEAVAVLVSVSTLPDGAPSRLFDGVPSSRSRTL
jgi:hypothetical protein